MLTLILSARASSVFPSSFGINLPASYHQCRSLIGYATHCLFNNFTITAEIHARSLAKFYGQYADRHMNLKFVRRVSEREREIRRFVIVKNKLMSVFDAPVLLLTMNFVITLSK